ncbi:MAG: glycosyltransferase family 2 protein [Candidatus Firestonebacteria bacterium]
MKISGFTIIRNALKYDFPVLEAISSLLPVCDEFVVAVGKSEDDTLSLIKSINSPKIKIIETVWDEELRKDGKVMAVETNKALAACTGDWCHYIQADEVLHEKDLPKIKKTLERCQDNKNIEGIEYNWIHFYGSYETFQDNRREWYAHEIRIIRRRPDIFSFGDAMGFRKKDEKGEWHKLKTANCGASIYHYGWVKPPKTMKVKKIETDKLYLPDEIIKKEEEDINEGNIYLDTFDLALFRGTHPKVMEERIKRAGWKFDLSKLSRTPRWLRAIRVFFHPLLKRLAKLVGMKEKQRRFYR